jgi:hypothetical protein
MALLVQTRPDDPRRACHLRWDCVRPWTEQCLKIILRPLSVTLRRPSATYSVSGGLWHRWSARGTTPPWRTGFCAGSRKCCACILPIGNGCGRSLGFESASALSNLVPSAKFYLSTPPNHQPAYSWRLCASAAALRRAHAGAPLLALARLHRFTSSTRASAPPMSHTRLSRLSPLQTLSALSTNGGITTKQQNRTRDTVSGRIDRQVLELVKRVAEAERRPVKQSRPEISWRTRRPPGRPSSKCTIAAKTASLARKRRNRLAAPTTFSWAARSLITADVREIGKRPMPLHTRSPAVATSLASARSPRPARFVDWTLAPDAETAERCGSRHQ